jgi:hypothetical protein
MMQLAGGLDGTEKFRVACCHNVQIPVDTFRLRVGDLLPRYDFPTSYKRQKKLSKVMVMIITSTDTV